MLPYEMHLTVSHPKGVNEVHHTAEKGEACGEAYNDKHSDRYCIHDHYVFDYTYDYKVNTIYVK